MSAWRDEVAAEARETRACDACGAQPGDYCLTATGRVTTPHSARRRPLDEARRVQRVVARDLAAERLARWEAALYPYHKDKAVLARLMALADGELAAAQVEAGKRAREQTASNVIWNCANRVGHAIGTGRLDGTNAAAVAAAIRAVTPEEFEAARHVPAPAEPSCNCPLGHGIEVTWFSAESEAGKIVSVGCPEHGKADDSSESRRP